MYMCVILLLHSHPILGLVPTVDKFVTEPVAVNGDLVCSDFRVIVNTYHN